MNLSKLAFTFSLAFILAGCVRPFSTDYSGQTLNYDVFKTATVEGKTVVAPFKQVFTNPLNSKGVILKNQEPAKLYFAITHATRIEIHSPVSTAGRYYDLIRQLGNKRAEVKHVIDERSEYLVVERRE